ncbi:MAG: PepSY domain-containing protein [Rhodoferax sp.]|jgi:uncharacterized membrane protein YkoI
MIYNNKLSILALAATMAGTVVYAANATAAEPYTSVKPFTGEKLVKNAKVTLVEARAIALKAHPGKITDEELENEGGGSGLRYSFDIKNAKGTQEVGVDAKTGLVLENKLEGPNPD